MHLKCQRLDEGSELHTSFKLHRIDFRVEFPVNSLPTWRRHWHDIVRSARRFSLTDSRSEWVKETETSRSAYLLWMNSQNQDISQAIHFLKPICNTSCVFGRPVVGHKTETTPAIGIYAGSCLWRVWTTSRGCAFYLLSLPFLSPCCKAAPQIQLGCG